MKTFIFLMILNVPFISKAESILKALDCSKIGYVDNQTGRCFIGPNTALITKFLELERELKESARTMYKWNHGRDKTLLDDNFIERIETK